MNSLVRRWRTGLRVLAVALVVATVPWPVWAQGTKQPPAAPGLKASISSAVRAVAAAKPAAAKEQAPTADKSALEKGSFFKTGPGIMVIAAIAAGTGYAIYTASHNRIHSTVPAGLQ
ncbi:MAG: hypothetical protein ACM3NQ_18895 [Bacteroidales bacterium]